MKAVRWHGPRDIRIEDVSEPPPLKPGELKLEIFWTGICGSDLHEYNAGPIFIPTEAPHPLSGIKAPVILGHEFSGKVVEVGEGVTRFKVGDRVTADACEVDWTCPACKEGRYNLCDQLGFNGLHRNGSLTKYMNVWEYMCYKLPDDLSNEAGALVEPISCAVHAVRRGKVLEGDSVAVLGAGPIGLSCLQAARAAGAKQVFVTEMAAARKEFAKNLGATAVLDPTEVDVKKEIYDMTDGIGPDVTIEAIGTPATGKQAVELVKKGGTAVIMGIFEEPGPFHFNEVVFFEKQIAGSIAYAGEYPATIALLADGRIKADPMITGRITLDEIVEKGFDELNTNKERNIKIIVKSE